MPRAVLFDLDRTLIGSVRDITFAVAELLRVWFSAIDEGSDKRTRLGEAPPKRTEILALADYSNDHHWNSRGELRQFRARRWRVCDEWTPAGG